MRVFPAGTRTAADAAAAVGCTIDQIVKSLVFVADSGPVLFLVSGANRVNEQAAARALGTSVLRKANADEVRKATGFAIGGTPPYGHPQALPTILDRDLLVHETVWAAAGTPDTCFPTDPRQLQRLTDARVMSVSAADE